jgi:hypothetical protein
VLVLLRYRGLAAAIGTMLFLSGRHLNSNSFNFEQLSVSLKEKGTSGTVMSMILSETGVSLPCVEIMLVCILESLRLGTL